MKVGSFTKLRGSPHKHVKGRVDEENNGVRNMHAICIGMYSMQISWVMNKYVPAGWEHARSLKRRYM